MKVRIIAVAFGLLMNCAAVFAADTAVLPMTKIIKNLWDAGFNEINEIELKKDVYKAIVLNNAGKKIDLKVDAKTGKILNLPAKDKDPAPLTFEEAIVRVEKAGYTRVEKIKLDRVDAYDVIAFDSRGKKAELEVDLYSGAVSAD